MVTECQFFTIIKFVGLYNRKYFAKRVRLREWQNTIGSFWGTYLQIKSIIDFGCGNGYLLEGMFLRKVEILGYEINLEEAEFFIPKEIQPYIYKKSVIDKIKTAPREYSLCTEVAEHIPTQFSSILVENICSNTQKRVIFTAAPPGQKGTGHINCQHPQFWEDLFYKFDFVINHNLRKTILKKMEEEGINGKWLSKNLMMFDRK